MLFIFIYGFHILIYIVIYIYNDAIMKKITTIDLYNIILHK